MTDTGETMGLREAKLRARANLNIVASHDAITGEPLCLIEQRDIAALTAPSPGAALSSRMDGGLFIVAMDGAAILHLKNPGDGLRLERLHSPTLATHQGVKLDEAGRIAFTEADSAGRQQARIAELEAALAPFAKVAEHYNGHDDADLVVVDLGQCRIARAALPQGPQQ